MDKATTEWLDAQKKTTKSTYKSSFKYFLEFTRQKYGLETGDQILADRQKDSEFKWEKIAFEYKDWLIKEKGFSEKTAVLGTASVRSFFAFHRIPLRFRRPESRRIREAKRRFEDYRFSREDLKKMAEVADLTEKYVLIVGKSFGLRAGDFLRLTRGDLEPYIDREPPISIGAYPTEKEGVYAYPFIDSDAKPIIKLMLEKMDREGRKDPKERILRYKDEIQLSRILKRLAEKAGINTGNKRVRFHCLRKFLIDRLASVMSESKWKQIVGKVIPEIAYVSPDTLREDYARAMKETCFTETVSGEDLQLLVKKEALMMLAKLQGMKESEIRQIFRERKITALKDEVETLEEIVEKRTATNGGLPIRTQKIIAESELGEYLGAGWKFVSLLNGNKAIVEK